MTKRQREKAIKTFKNELRYHGWSEDRYGNFLSGEYRVKLTDQLWKLERKVDKKWINVEAKPLNALKEGDAPKPRPITVKQLLNGAEPASEAVVDEPPVRKIRRLTRSKNITADEAQRSDAPLKVLVSLDEASQKRIDAMAFKQVQTNSRLFALEGVVAKLTDTIGSTATMVQEQLRRIKAKASDEADVVFNHRMFNKISLRLRKKSIDVQVEDLSSGVKRRRVFRCSDYSKVEHFITYRTLADGIEEIERRVPSRKAPAGKGKGVAKKRAKAPVSEAQRLADLRHQMERDNIKNHTVPMVTDSRKSFDSEANKKQIEINRSREKAEKVITKICSHGGVAEGAKDKELIEALVENGFDQNVAFYAAMNCGRVSDPNLIRQHERSKNKGKRSKVGATSNDY